MPRADQVYELQTRLLYGPGTWFEECHDALAAGPSEVAALVRRLAPGRDVHRALRIQATWPGRSRLEAADDAEDGPGLSAARAVAAVAAILSGEPETAGRLRQATAHWRRAQVMPGHRLSGAAISQGDASAVLRRLAVLADETPGDNAECGFVALLVRALSDEFPRPGRGVEMPVLFDRRRTGGHGVLRLDVMDEGPPGLYPDPRTMMFLVADRQFADAVGAARHTVPERLAGACVLWRRTFRAVSFSVTRACVSRPICRERSGSPGPGSIAPSPR